MQFAIYVKICIVSVFMDMAGFFPQKERAPGKTGGPRFPLDVLHVLCQGRLLLAVVVLIFVNLARHLVLLLVDLAALLRR